ncbi:hypothetical protein MN608_08507 [Microdochium nivale]|nr:hypothetical protein MN608_08507 [Microdochium nivale]
MVAFQKLIQLFVALASATSVIAATEGVSSRRALGGALIQRDNSCGASCDDNPGACGGQCPNCQTNGQGWRFCQGDL